jgi:serine/threonine protein kinase
MKHFQTTLAQCKISLPEKVLLNYGRQIEVAIKFLHSAGICHLDIKPSNIFMLEGNCYLGDYGAAKQVGEEIHEISRNYYPKEVPIVAETKTDFLLLAKTLLELFGEIDSPVQPMYTGEILEAVHKVKNDRVRSFLVSLLECN